jgi:mono/diheme cytochrome c family protein
VDLIDHEQSPRAPVEDVTAEYGKYLITLGDCTECHGANLTGASSFNKGGLPGPNLTPGGVLKGWSEVDFLRALRDGVRPDGSKISDQMPWNNYRLMTDNELQAIWLYLQSLPAIPTSDPK